jgi:hypothetical protein
MLAGAAAMHLPARIKNPHFSARAPEPGERADGKMLEPNPAATEQPAAEVTSRA